MPDEEHLGPEATEPIVGQLLAVVAYSPHDAELAAAHQWGGRATVGGVEWTVKPVGVAFDSDAGLWLSAYSLSRPRARVVH